VRRTHELIREFTMLKVEEALGLPEWTEYVAKAKVAFAGVSDESIPLYTRCKAHLEANRAYQRFTAAINAKEQAAQR
jgi:hypothetical protein